MLFLAPRVILDPRPCDGCSQPDDTWLRHSLVQLRLLVVAARVELLFSCVGVWAWNLASMLEDMFCCFGTVLFRMMPSSGEDGGQRARKHSTRREECIGFGGAACACCPIAACFVALLQV